MLLHVSLVDNQIPHSFLPEESDLVPNALKLEQLVGTLIKETQGNSGNSEPYLARSWSTNASGTEYTFEFRENLKCEDGSSINSGTFKRSLMRTLRARAAEHDVAIFNRLKGWDDFRQGAHLEEGIIASDDGSKLLFRFRDRTDGLLEILSMPQFGHYCDANYTEQDRWIDPLRIVSSGAYRVESATPEKIVLAARSDWFSHSPNGPSRLEFTNVTRDIARFARQKSRILVIRTPVGDEELPGFNAVPGAPLFLTAAVLAPATKGPFKSDEYRRNFASRLRLSLRNLRQPKTHAIYEDSFYLGFPLPTLVHPTSNARAAESDLGPVRIARLSSSASLDAIHLEKAITDLLTEDRVKYEFVEYRRDPGFLKRLYSNTEFDIRIARVDIGLAPVPWVIDMMFCSKLGISFPDPSRRICGMIQDSRQLDSGPLSPTAMHEFNQALADDAAVVPAYHSGMRWLISDDLDLGTTSNHMVVPRFERLRYSP